MSTDRLPEGTVPRFRIQDLPNQLTEALGVWRIWAPSNLPKSPSCGFITTTRTAVPRNALYNQRYTGVAL